MEERLEKLKQNPPNTISPYHGLCFYDVAHNLGRAGTKDMGGFFAEERESRAKSPLQVKMDCDGADGRSRETYEGVARIQTREGGVR